MENTYVINNSETSVDSLRSITAFRAQKRERQFGYFVPPYPEDLLNILAYLKRAFALDNQSRYAERIERLHAKIDEDK